MHGQYYKNKPCGSFGIISTFSLNPNKHITTGECGMIVCKNKKDYDLLYTMRSHGWDRGLNNSNKIKKFKSKYSDYS